MATTTKLIEIDYAALADAAEKTKEFAPPSGETPEARLQRRAVLIGNLKRAARHIGVDEQRIEDLTPSEQVYAAIVTKAGTLSSEQDGKTGIFEPRFVVEDVTVPPLLPKPSPATTATVTPKPAPVTPAKSK